jgi:hypothetical protein
MEDNLKKNKEDDPKKIMKDDLKKKEEDKQINQNQPNWL